MMANVKLMSSFSSVQSHSLKVKRHKNVPFFWTLQPHKKNNSLKYYNILKEKMLMSKSHSPTKPTPRLSSSLTILSLVFCHSWSHLCRVINV